MRLYCSPKTNQVFVILPGLVYWHDFMGQLEKLRWLNHQRQCIPGFQLGPEVLCLQSYPNIGKAWPTVLWSVQMLLKGLLANEKEHGSGWTGLLPYALLGLQHDFSFAYSRRKGFQNSNALLHLWQRSRVKNNQNFIYYRAKKPGHLLQRMVWILYSLESWNKWWFPLEHIPYSFVVLDYQTPPVVGNGVCAINWANNDMESPTKRCEIQVEQNLPLDVER